MTRYDFKCPQCGMVYEVESRIDTPVKLYLCPTCQVPTVRYFGHTSTMRVNYGFRPSKHGSIEEFQFTNL